MIELIEQQRDALKALCQQYNVRRLELFGSAVSEQFDEHTSNLDFLVEFKSLETGHAANNYFGLLFGLQSLFGRNVYLVMPGAVKNPYFLESIHQRRKLLYAA